MSPAQEPVIDVESQLLRARIAEQDQIIAQLRADNAELKEQLAVLTRMVFGRSSEKAADGGAGAAGQGEPKAGEQGSLAGGMSHRAEAGSGKQKGQRRGSRGHGRRDYSQLPFEMILLELEEALRVCARCGAAYEQFGYEDSEQLDWRVVVLRIVWRRCRYRRVCDCGDQCATKVAPRAAKPIPKGLFTASFLAHLLHEKYVLGRPLHRIVAALAAEGLHLAEGTLVGAMRQLAGLLAPVNEEICARNAAAAHLHCDETTWRVFEQIEGKQGNRWWLWVCLADDSIVFLIDPTRSADVLEAHLGIRRADGELETKRRLVISSDFYGVYQSFAAVEGIDALWCWAHARRHILRAADGEPRLRHWCDTWIDRIAVLYAAHHARAVAWSDSQTATATATATGQFLQAQKAFTDALDAIEAARTEQLARHSLHPAARKALNTLERQWDGLAAHADHPDKDLDNNAAERALRNPVVGRKNFYGSGARWAADLAAATWTITATAQRNGHNPLTYLTDYLTSCAENGGKPLSAHDLHQFLPWNRPATTREPGRLHEPADQGPAP